MGGVRKPGKLSVTSVTGDGVDVRVRIENGARTRARKVSNPTRRFLLREKGGKEGTGRPMLPIRPGTRGATVVFRTLRRLSPTLVHHLAGPRRIVCTAASCWSSSDGRLPVVQPSIRRLRRRQFAPIN